MKITKDGGDLAEGTALWLDCNRVADNERLLTAGFEVGRECKVYYYHSPSDNTVWISMAAEQIVLLE